MILNILEITGIAALVGGLTTILIENTLIKGRDFESRQWALKRDACLEALSAVDAMFSNQVWTNVPRQPTIQKVEILKFRECHSKLILSCNNIKTVEKFLEIMFYYTTETCTQSPQTELLNEFRNLIREELNFGSKLEFNKEKAWIGSIIGDDK